LLKPKKPINYEKNLINYDGELVKIGFPSPNDDDMGLGDTTSSQNKFGFDKRLLVKHAKTGLRNVSYRKEINLFLQSNIPTKGITVTDK
jgi:hypothetical protein